MHLPDPGLFGNLEVKLDEKGRVALPARWRPVYGVDPVYMLPFSEGCIAMYPSENFQRLREEVKAHPSSTEEGRAQWGQRFPFVEVDTLDAQGRLLVPQRLLERVGFTKGSQLVFGGMDEFVELWTPQGFAEHRG